MTLSDDTASVVEFLDGQIEGGLRKKNDIGALLEISAERGDFLLVNQIVFTGKSVYNLYSKLKKVQDDNVHILQKQLALSADELRVLLDRAMPDEMVELRKRFEVTYLENNSGCLANLVDLSFDLSVLKDLQSKRLEVTESDNNELQ